MRGKRDVLQVFGASAFALGLAWLVLTAIWHFTLPAALMKATYDGDDNQVRSLLARGANPNERNESYTALTSAAVGCNAQTVKLMLEKGAAVNTKDQHGWTALHFAAVHNHVDTAKVLLSAGADINAKDDNGDTPIMMAADRSRVEMVQFLLSSKADPKGALASARGKNRARIIRLLKQHGAN